MKPRLRLIQTLKQEKICSMSCNGECLKLSGLNNLDYIRCNGEKNNSEDLKYNCWNIKE